MQSYVASCIDIACKPLVINQSWLYDRHLNTSMMKEKLAELLSEYPTMAGRISGDTRDFDNAYPDGAWTSFRRTVFDLSAQFEYNFLGYGTNAYRGDRRFTPYILGGAGLTLATRGSNTFTVNFPVGAGIKYKVASRVNIGCELTMRFTLSDCLDMEHESGLQLNDPYQIKGKGLKNKDSYACVLFFLTYDLFPKCKECNN